MSLFPLSPTRPKAPRKPTFPGSKASNTPLAGPNVPIPREQEEALIARFNAWRQGQLGSLPEFIVWEFLTIKKRQVPGIDFIFQSPFFGGRTRFGGFVADFLFPLRKEIWQVQGERFHLEKPSDRARTKLTKLLLSSRGLRILEIWEDDLLSRPDFVLSLAWDHGAEVSSKAGN